MDNKLFNMIINKLKQRDLWFTTKNDPTWQEAPEYYELDEYGDPVEKTQQQIMEEVNDYVGDGAIDLNDAIDMWIDEALNNFKIGLVDYLKTSFKSKPVVDQIEAFETPNQLTEDNSRNIKTEGVKIDGMTTEIPEEFSEPKQPEPWKEDLEKIATAYANSKEEQYKKATNQLSESTECDNIDANLFEITNGDVTYTIKRMDDGKWVDDNGNKYMSYLTPQDILHYYDGFHITTKLGKKITESLSMESIYNLIGQANNQFQVATLVRAMGYVDSGVAGVLQDQFSTMKKSGTSFEDMKDRLLHTISVNMKADVDKLTASKQIKTEDAKRRLKEENNKSQNTITDIVNSPDFDENTNQGKIVLRTEGLFNLLSDKGFDVQVTFDNGESQSVILLGQQGGKVILTITGAENPIGMFVSGNYPLSLDIINKLTDILNTIQNINN